MKTAGALVFITLSVAAGCSVQLNPPPASGNNCASTVIDFTKVSPIPPLLGVLVNPPSQPDTGPGGSVYSFSGVAVSGPFLADAQTYFVYEPALPTPASAPLVIFLHGWGGVNPSAYGDFLMHLVRKMGYTVIYPVYQTSLNDASLYVGNAVTAIKDAIATLHAPCHVPLDLSKVGMVTHSLGGVIGAAIANGAAAAGLPHISAMFIGNPGDVDTNSPGLSAYDILPADLSAISNTLLLVALGIDDGVAGLGSAKAQACQDSLGNAVDPVYCTDAYNIFMRTTAIPPQNKNFIYMISDRYTNGAECSSGSGFSCVPLINANHAAELASDVVFDSGMSPLTGSGGAGKPADVLSFYGYWKWAVALLDSAFNPASSYKSYALGKTANQRDMGRWSDGATNVCRAEVYSVSDLQAAAPTFQQPSHHLCSRN